MMQDPYEQLAKALDRLPNGFPRTQSGVEIAILKKIFSPAEADLACQLSGNYEPLPRIAERMGLTVEEAQERLVGMAKSGLIWFQRGEDQLEFRLAPFIVGIYEAQREAIDHELAHLFEHYMAEGGAAGIMKPQPALHRVIPAQKAVKSEWILPYDDVHKILLSAKSFTLSDCICRMQQEHLQHRKCDFPMKACLSFSSREPSNGSNGLSKGEALAALATFEETGACRLTLLFLLGHAQFSTVFSYRFLPHPIRESSPSRLRLFLFGSIFPAASHLPTVTAGREGDSSRPMIRSSVPLSVSHPSRCASTSAGCGSHRSTAIPPQRSGSLAAANDRSVGRP